MKDQQFNAYAGISISQRGIGYTAMPSFECAKEHMKLPPKGLNRSYRWVLTGATGKSYNFLDWAGTRMLAQDIEHFREKTCSPKLHLNGMSYGTAVAAVYADMFPERVGKMVINGNMPPVPFTLDFAKGQGKLGEKHAGTWAAVDPEELRMALTQAFGHLERLCVTWTSTPPCNLYSSEMSLSHVWAQLVSDLRAGRITAPTEIHSKGGTVNFPLSIGLVQGYVQDRTNPGLISVGEQQMGNPGDPPGVGTWILRFAQWLRHAMEWSGHLVDLRRVRRSAVSWPLKHELQQQPWSDLFGRFTVDQAVKIWQDFSSVWDEMATSAFVGIFSEIFAWQREAVPVHAGFRQNVRALVVGNLYDPACAVAECAASNAPNMCFECAKVLELTNFSAGEEIIREGEEGFDCFIVDTGECYASIEINGERKEVLKYEPGGFFGERALLRTAVQGSGKEVNRPSRAVGVFAHRLVLEGRAATVSARSDVKLLKLSAEEFVSMIEERDHKDRGTLGNIRTVVRMHRPGVGAAFQENLIRHIKEFDILTDAQVALLAGALERRWFDQADALIYGQVEESNNFYILEDGPKT
eukprot:g31507.t1